MTVQVRLFARLRDLAGSNSLVLELPSGSTVADLRHHLTVEYPQLTSLLERCAIGVNNEFAENALRLPDGAEIALLPPVSGG
jgi:molybdopterin converting factor subunit 1